MSFRRPCCRPCGEKTIVYPTKCNQTYSCSESTVNHVHPSHTNHVNNHIIKNKHFYPHTNSQQNTVSQVNVFGGNTFPPGGGGAFNQGGFFNTGGPGPGPGPFNQGGPGGFNQGGFF